jgi:ATP-dependent DNA helicase RecG
MEVKQIIEIIGKGENQEIEFKESFHSAQEISKILCSFANTLGGILFLGVTNSGEITGIKENLDRIQQKISSSNQSISPVPLIGIENCTIKGKNIILAVTQRSSDASYHTFQGAIYVRVGSTTRRLEGQTHIEYLRNRQILSFDESYEGLATINDLNESKIRAYLKSRNQESYLNTHNIKDFLISNKLTSSNGKLKIKNSAILLFAKDPIKFIPQAELKLVQFSGVEPVEIVSHKLIQDDLVDSIEQVLSFIRSHINKKIEIKKSGKREEEYEYPLDVVREAIVNAIAHRDYFSKDAIQIYLFENRIEITNPGSLPHGLPKELFGTISVQRNPITYRFLRDLRYVEGLGTGVPRMKNNMREAGLSDPEFIFTESFFRIILYNKKGKHRVIEGEKDLNERQKQALEYLRKHKALKAQTYAEINNVSHATAVNEINELIEFGFLNKIGAFRGAYYVLKIKQHQ